MSRPIPRPPGSVCPLPIGHFHVCKHLESNLLKIELFQIPQPWEPNLSFLLCEPRMSSQTLSPVGFIPKYLRTCPTFSRLCCHQPNPSYHFLSGPFNSLLTDCLTAFLSASWSTQPTFHVVARHLNTLSWLTSFI